MYDANTKNRIKTMKIKIQYAWRFANQINIDNHQRKMKHLHVFDIKTDSQRENKKLIR